MSGAMVTRNTGMGRFIAVIVVTIAVPVAISGGVSSISPSGAFVAGTAVAGVTALG